MIFLVQLSHGCLDDQLGDNVEVWIMQSPVSRHFVAQGQSKQCSQGIDGIDGIDEYCIQWHSVCMQHWAIQVQLNHPISRQSRVKSPKFKSRKSPTVCEACNPLPGRRPSLASYSTVFFKSCFKCSKLSMLYKILQVPQDNQWVPCHTTWLQAPAMGSSEILIRYFSKHGGGLLAWNQSMLCKRCEVVQLAVFVHTIQNPKIFNFFTYLKN